MSVVESLDKTHYFTVANAFFPLVFPENHSNPCGIFVIPAENSWKKSPVLPHRNNAIFTIGLETFECFPTKYALCLEIANDVSSLFNINCHEAQVCHSRLISYLKPNGGNTGPVSLSIFCLVSESQKSNSYFKTSYITFYVY